MEGDCYVEEAIVETDENIGPISNVRRERVLAAEDFVRSRTVNVVDDTYVSIKVQKSPVQRTYYRSFIKIDSLLSYTGGIVGSIIGLL